MPLRPFPFVLAALFGGIALAFTRLDRDPVLSAGPDRSPRRRTLPPARLLSLDFEGPEDAEGARSAKIRLIRHYEALQRRYPGLEDPRVGVEHHEGTLAFTLPVPRALEPTILLDPHDGGEDPVQVVDRGAVEVVECLEYRIDAERALARLARFAEEQGLRLHGWERRPVGGLLEDLVLLRAPCEEIRASRP